MVFVKAIKSQRFIETQYVRSDESVSSIYVPASGAYMQPYATPMVTRHTTTEVERIPPGELAVRRGAKVEATDGTVGKVGEFVVDPESGKITHLILLEGHLLGKKEVTLPVAAIKLADPHTVYLKLDKRAVAQLPALPVSRRYRKDVTGKVKVELFARVFDNPRKADEVYEDLRMMHLRGNINMLGAAVMVKDKDGKTSLNQRGDVDARHGTLFGAITGGLVGLLGGPVGVVVGAVTGAATGRVAAKKIDVGFSDKFLKGLQERLQPDTSAIIVLVEHEWAQKFTDALAGTEGTFLQETLADDIVAQLLEEAGEQAGGDG